VLLVDLHVLLDTKANLVDVKRPRAVSIGHRMQERKPAKCKRPEVSLMVAPLA
jgi:hypothetical protein